MASRGLLPATRIGNGRWLFRPDDLLETLEPVRAADFDRADAGTRG
jgi:hypothetical protein